VITTLLDPVIPRVAGVPVVVVSVLPVIPTGRLARTGAAFGGAFDRCTAGSLASRVRTIAGSFGAAELCAAGDAGNGAGGTK
jgi:hypothetical protein